jgi:hypothetical protein
MWSLFIILAKNRTTILHSFNSLLKLLKAAVSFVMSVCPSVHPPVRMEQLYSHWTSFREIWYFSIFRKSVEKIQVSLNSDENNGYFT